MKKTALLLLLVQTLLSANPFGQGSLNIGLGVGSGSVSYSNGFLTKVEDYYIVGVSGDYFVFDNLALGLAYQGWVGGTPAIHQASLPVTYYIPTGSKFRPYAGLLYRYTYMNSDLYDNYSSVGGRAGLAILFHKGYVALGWLQEYRLEEGYSSDRNSGYPEITVGFTF